jgi:hypothetical protein
MTIKAIINARTMTAALSCAGKSLTSACSIASRAAAVAASVVSECRSLGLVARLIPLVMRPKEELPQPHPLGRSSLCALHPTFQGRYFLDRTLQAKDPCPSVTRAPALGERSHCSLARRLAAVRRSAYVAVVATRPHPGAALRRNRHHLENATDDDAPFGALNDVVKKRKSRVVWYPVERHVNVHPMMAGSAEVLASQGL